MCRTLGCFIHMRGHGKEIGSMDELAALLGSLGQLTRDQDSPEQTQEQFIQEAIESAETNIRMNEIAVQILKSEPPEEGAKLVSLEAMKPIEPAKHGVATIATYALESGAFLVVGTDHLTQKVHSHTAPNLHGVSGLIQSIKVEIEDDITKADAEAEAAAAKASSSTEAEPESQAEGASQEADTQGTATS